jgi:hypothetical protein
MRGQMVESGSLLHESRIFATFEQVVAAEKLVGTLAAEHRTGVVPFDLLRQLIRRRRGRSHEGDLSMQDALNQRGGYRLVVAGDRAVIGPEHLGGEPLKAGLV